MIKYLSLLVGCVFVLACKKSGFHRAQGEALGTYYQIIYDGPTKLQQKDFDALIEAANQSLSTYREDSFISKLNRGEANEVSADSLFLRVFYLSKEVYKESRGYFDPTVGLLIDAYGFKNNALHELSETQLDSLRQRIGFDKVKLNPQNQVLLPEGMRLDFNALAKGYIVDLVFELIERKTGAKSILVDIGGEIRTAGKNEDGKSWKVGIENPIQGKKDQSYSKIIELSNRSMATSGNYRKFLKSNITGKTYVHTINPKTGEAIASNVLSASVLADNCAVADGFATALMACGIEEAKTILNENPKIDAYFIYIDSLENHQTYATPGFKSHLVN